MTEPCAEGWTELNQACYKSFFEYSDTYDNDLKICRKYDARLLVLRNWPEERKDLFKYL